MTRFRQFFKRFKRSSRNRSTSTYGRDFDDLADYLRKRIENGEAVIN